MKSILIFFLSIIIFMQPLSALEVKGISELKIDTSIIKQDLIFGVPDKIVVTPIQISIESEINSNVKLRGIYYYLIQKLGYTDIPFHYFINEKGDIFKGNSGGDERKTKIKGVEGNVLLIGYLDENNSLTGKVKDNLQELLLNLSNTFGIPSTRISLEGIKFVRDRETRTYSIEKKVVDVKWTSEFNLIKNFITSNYSPIEREYLGITQVQSNQSEYIPGNEYTISIKVKNTGENGFYGDSNSELILTKRDSGASNLFVNNEWISKTQVKLMKEDQMIKKDDEESFEFKIKVPLFIGEYSENFILKTLGGNTIKGTEFSINLNIKKSNKPIVEIQNTELGYLRVRKEPSTLADEIAKVNPGERFFVDEDAGNGYIRITLDNGITGWVAGWFTSQIN